MKSNEGTWIYLAHGVVKINTDATWVADQNGGLGVVIRDHLGDVQTIVAAPHSPSYSVEIAELLALIRGCEVAWSQGFVDIVLETDNANIVAAYNNSGVIDFMGASIFEEFKSWCSRFRVCNIRYVRRIANVVAHKVAAWGKTLDHEVILFNHVPSFLASFVNFDKCNPRRVLTIFASINKKKTC
ncbi:hypothetical protein M5689_006713 [Euphorbia peplus]|nr:hypothetical protein M5689_006713 [Euphorbia peplus]